MAPRPRWRHLCGLAALVALAALVTTQCSRARPTPTPEPLVPTVAPHLRTTPTPRPHPTLTVTPAPRDPALRARLCAGVPGVPITDFPYHVLGLGWYLDWRALAEPPQTPGVRYARMVRVRDGKLHPTAEKIAAIARDHPGELWLIGNEPDVPWQDGVTPEGYATLYHDAYQAIKAADPSARVAIGGVSQVTPLRLAYLERVLDAYRARYGEPFPADVWNVHTFILREERDSWGVGIPPGFEDVSQGTLWNIDDHDRIDLLRRQLLDIRRWLYNRGYAGIPLIVTEYGILMPPEYGFPPEQVIAFLRKSFDLFLTARDPVMGNPEDEGRLVQAWCWFSMGDRIYPTGNLFDPDTRAITPVGVAFATYTPP